MMSLLEKMRSLNKLLQAQKDNVVNFDALSRVLSNMIECNAYILGTSGQLLGHHFYGDFYCSVMEQIIVRDKRMPESYNKDLLNTEETKANMPNQDGMCVFNGKECGFGNKITTVIPIAAGGERQGTLMIAKFDVPFTDDDLILSEYGATIVGIEIFRSKTEQIEEEARSKAAVQIALDTLSYSELEAVEHIFAELDGDEGLLVASKIADRVGITRSVIVNALRKFESAGVIESKSLGMKGTYIRIRNDNLLAEIKKRTVLN